LDSYSLFELNEYIRRVIALNFAEPVWIHAEIGQVGVSRGQYYISLVEKNDKSDAIVAQSEAVIWYKSVLFLKKKLGGIFDSLVQQGTQVKVKVKIDHHERYGLKLVIEDIDPKYTIGQLELQRQAILDKLEAKGLIDINEQIPLPSVLQNIAVISSETAAGYKDFIKQIEQNAYWYDYNLMLYNTAVQGHRVRAEVSRALKTIKEEGICDCVVITRGGGSKMDLAAFDDFEIGEAIASSDVPVITAIGHQIDNTVADIVAHTSVKTPTAAADFLIEHNSQFEAKVLLLEERINQIAVGYIQHAKVELDKLESNIQSQATLNLWELNNGLDNTYREITTTARQSIKFAESTLSNIEQQLDLMDPKYILKRGFAAIKQSGKYVQKAKSIDYTKDIQIELADDSILATPVKK
jgi:exodeoxyribonuclease VII large subunit